MIQSRINDRWDIVLTDDRHAFHAVRPKWESGRLASCFERMTPGMVVYDVGAESGDFTCLYRGWVGSGGDVVPVEPQPAYWPSIRATWEANGFAPPRAWFSGFASDVTDLAPPRDDRARDREPVDGWPRSAYGEIAPDFGFRHLAQQADSTPQTRLDELAPAPDAIVMDIEGAELRALQGCTGLLAGKRPLIWVSVHEPTMLEWYGATLGDILSLMASFDYAAEELPWFGEGETFWFFAPEERA